MHLSGTIELKTDDGEMSFTQDITFIITDMRPLFDGKPGSEEADKEKMKVTLMSPDGKVEVITMGIENNEENIYKNVTSQNKFEDFIISR